MKKLSLSFVLGALLLVLIACLWLQAQPAGGNFQVEVVAENLEVPWALAFAPDGRLFITERRGRVRVVQDGRLLAEPWATLEVAAVSEAGLMGIAIDPNFAQNGFVYLCYTYRAQGRLQNRVARLKEENKLGSQLTVLLDNIPGANIHDGCRLKFGPDGKLYITMGDAAIPDLAQDLTSLAGKILRINADGSIPAENPFKNSPVWSYGHRNPQGIAWHPVTQKLFSTEHGPSGLPPNCCHDELNLIEPGKNYGWPEVFGSARRGSYVDPILESGLETWAPAGMVVYSSDRLPFKHNILFTALRGQHLHRVVLKAPDFVSVESHEKLFAGTYGRLRDVIEGPDGYLYIATSNRDGRGTPARNDDRILRLVPR